MNEKEKEITAYHEAGHALVGHVLPDSDAAAEWLKGTAAIPYVERLLPHDRAAFLERFRVALRDALPATPLFFGFKRTLFAASRAL